MTKKRTHGTGSISRTASGKYKGTIRVLVKGEQKRISKTFATRKEVERWFNEVSGQNVKYHTPATISEYFEHFLEMKEGVYRESTLYGIKLFYQKHIKGSILDKTRFSDLDATIINRYFLGLASHGYASSTLVRWRKNFKSILEMAMYEGYIEENPMNSPRIVKKLKGKPARPITPFTKEEVRKLLNMKNLRKLPVVYQTYILLAFLTGARPQEIMALNKSDVTLTSVSFNKSLGLHGKLQDCMKTPYSVRTVPIPEKYGRILEDNKKTLPHGENIFYSCKSANGYLSKDNIGWRFKRYVSAVLGGTTKHRLYDTRHTYATLLITVDKVDVKTVSRLMGHSNIETTLRYYTHAAEFPCYTVLRV